MKIYGIIPARYKSTRLPAKALADISGKPMIWHVYQQAKKATLDELFLATDDERIKEVALALHIPVVMTSTKHSSGTERIKEGIECFLQQKTQSEDILSEDNILINIQGDEPLLHPEMLNQLIHAFKENPHIQVATLAKKFHKKEAEEKFLSPNVVKVVFNKKNKALYFSRSPLPYARDEDTSCVDSDFYAHVGIYGYTYNALKKFTQLEQSTLEQIEKLEQLRFLENDIPIHIIQTEFESVGVDTQEDLEKVRKLIK